MKHLPKHSGWLMLVLITCVGIAGIAWQHHPLSGKFRNQTDTLPKKNRMKDDKTVINGDLDKALEEINKAKENLEKEWQGKDWDRVQEQINQALKQIDVQKIQMQAMAAMQQVDWQKMQKEMQEVQQKIAGTDMVQMQEQVAVAMEKARKAMAEMKSVDMEKMQREMQKAQEAFKMNEGKIKEAMERANEKIRKTDFRKEMRKVKEGMDDAEGVLKNYKEMLAAMDKDGLLHINQSYSVEYNKGVLTIDGKIQPASVTNKYKHYFKKENVQLRKVVDSADNEARVIDL